MLVSQKEQFRKGGIRPKGASASTEAISKDDPSQMIIGVGYK